jgi:hypothetical protein
VLVPVISAHAVEEERIAASIMLSFAWPGTGIKRKELRTKLCISREDSTLDEADDSADSLSWAGQLSVYDVMIHDRRSSTDVERRN